MKVSVVIPLYNKVRHIRRAIDSVLKQTCQDFELVIVDDGSTDGSGDIVRQFADPRIRLIVQANAGASAARNRGICEAVCDLVAFLDADDEWLPCFLETVIGLRAHYPEAGMYATAYRYSQGESTWRAAFTDCVTSPQGGFLNDYFRAALGPPPVSSSAVMIPKYVLTKVGCFPPGIRRGEDLQTWAAIALHYRVAWSPLEGAVYHLSTDNRTCTTDPVNLDFPGASKIEAALRLGPQAPLVSDTALEYLASWRLRMAVSWHIKGKKDIASRLLQQTQHTKVFRRKRLFLRAAFLIPPCGWRLARTVKAALRQPHRRSFAGVLSPN